MLNQGCQHKGFHAHPLRHPDTRIIWTCVHCGALKTDVQDIQIRSLQIGNANMLEALQDSASLLRSLPRGEAWEQIASQLEANDAAIAKDRIPCKRCADLLDTLRELLDELDNAQLEFEIDLTRARTILNKESIV